MSSSINQIECVNPESINPVFPCYTDFGITRLREHLGSERIIMYPDAQVAPQLFQIDADIMDMNATMRGPVHTLRGLHWVQQMPWLLRLDAGIEIHQAEVMTHERLQNMYMLDGQELPRNPIVRINWPDRNRIHGDDGHKTGQVCSIALLTDPAGSFDSLEYMNNPEGRKNWIFKVDELATMHHPAGRRPEHLRNQLPKGIDPDDPKVRIMIERMTKLMDEGRASTHDRTFMVATPIDYLG